MTVTSVCTVSLAIVTLAGLQHSNSDVINIAVVTHMGIVCFFPAMPFFIEEPKDEVSSEEEDIEFTCKAGGVPAPAVEWSFNGELYDSTTSE